MSKADKASKPGLPSAEEVNGVIQGLAAEASLHVDLETGRRETDLTMATIYGDKAAVLSLPLQLLERLPQLDLEIVQSEDGPFQYTLALAITEKLEQQTHQQPERRAKLRLFLKRELENLKDETS